MNLTPGRPQPHGVRLAVDVPGDEGRASLDDEVGVNVIGVNVLDRLGRQREEAQPIGGPAPVAIQSHLLESHHERIPRLGSLDEEWPGERVERLGPFLVFLIEPRRVDRLRRHHLAGLDPLEDRVRMGKSAVVRRRDDARRFVGRDGRTDREKDEGEGQGDSIHAWGPK